MKWNEAIVKFLGEDVPSDETINEKFTVLLAEHASLKTEKEGLSQEVITFKAEAEELQKLKPMAEVGETYLADQRKEAERLYRLLKGDDASEGMLKLVQNADIEQAKAYVTEFGRDVEEKIPGLCSECGKPAKLIRRSSKELAELKTNDTKKADFQTRAV